MLLNNRNPNITITSSKALGVIRSSGHNVTTKAVYCLTSLSYVRRPCLPISRYSSTNRIHKVRIFHRYIISFLLPEKQIYWFCVVPLKPTFLLNVSVFGFISDLRQSTLFQICLDFCCFVLFFHRETFAHTIILG